MSIIIYMGLECCRRRMRHLKWALHTNGGGFYGGAYADRLRTLDRDRDRERDTDREQEMRASEHDA